MLGAVKLQHRLEGSMARRGVRQHGQQLQGGREADAAAPYVRHVAHAERGRHIGNLLALRKTASGASVRLQYVDGASGEHLAEAPAREFAFPASDGDRLAAAHLDIGIEIVRNHGLLEPADIQRGDPASEFDRLDGIKAVVGIEHEPGRWSDRLAYGTDQPLVLIDAEPDLELDCREPLNDVALNLVDDVVERVAFLQAIGAGRISPDLAAQRPTHQDVDRRLEVAALEIPERDVDA